MNKNRKSTIDLDNDNFTYLNIVPGIEKPTMSLPAYLQNRIAEPETELLVTKFRLSELQQVLDAIPACPLHGKNCVPHAIDWIRKGINHTVTHPNSKKSKTGNKTVAEKMSDKNDVQYIAKLIR